MSIFKKAIKTVNREVIRPAVRRSGVSPYVKAGAYLVSAPVRGYRSTTRAIRKSTNRTRRGR